MNEAAAMAIGSPQKRSMAVIEYPEFTYWCCSIIAGRPSRLKTRVPIPVETTKVRTTRSNALRNTTERSFHSPA
jgi:hypothetical protein